MAWDDGMIFQNLPMAQKFFLPINGLVSQICTAPFETKKRVQKSAGLSKNQIFMLNH